MIPRDIFLLSTFNTLKKSKKNREIRDMMGFFKSLQKWFEPIVVRFRRKQGMLQAFFHKKDQHILVCSGW